MGSSAGKTNSAGNENLTDSEINKVEEKNNNESGQSETINGDITEDSTETGERSINREGNNSKMNDATITNNTNVNDDTSPDVEESEHDNKDKTIVDNNTGPENRDQESNNEESPIENTTEQVADKTPDSQSQNVNIYDSHETQSSEGSHQAGSTNNSNSGTERNSQDTFGSPSEIDIRTDVACRDAGVNDKNTVTVSSSPQGRVQTAEVVSDRKDTGVQTISPSEELPRSDQITSPESGLANVSDANSFLSVTENDGKHKANKNIDILLCYLCGKQYKDPRLLTCFHTFCYQCLFKYTMKNIIENKVKCPLCDTLNTVPAIGVRGFDQNIFTLTNESAKHCGSCKENDESMVRCDVCDQNLCSRCKSFHSDTFPNHVAYPVVVRNSEECKTHNKTNSFVCFQCNIPICDICNVTTHKMHEIGDCKSLAIEQKHDLEKNIDNCKKSKIVMDIKDLMDNRMVTIQAMENNILNNIDEQAKVLHACVETCRENFRREALEMVTNLQSRPDIKEMNRSVTSVESRLWFAEQFFEKAEDGELATRGQSLNRSLIETLKIEVKYKELDRDIRFISKETGTSEITKLYGDIFIRDLIKKPKNVFKISNTLSTSVKGATVSGLHPAEGHVWVCVETNLEHLDKLGGIISSTNIGFPLDDVTALKNGTLLISCPSRRRIVSVASTGKGKTFLKTTLCPRGLALDENENIISCQVEKDTFFDCTGEIEACVSCISSGREQDSIIKGELQYPARVAIGKDQLIIVSDWVQLAVFIYQDEREIGCYRGNPSISEDFIPRGVCSTSDGDIIVVDIAMNLLHLISNEGKFKRVLAELGNIDEPWSVASDDDGNLWIGTTGGLIHIVHKE